MLYLHSVVREQWAKSLGKTRLARSDRWKVGFCFNIYEAMHHPKYREVGRCERDAQRRVYEWDESPAGEWEGRRPVQPVFGDSAHTSLRDVLFSWSHG